MLSLIVTVDFNVNRKQSVTFDCLTDIDKLFTSLILFLIVVFEDLCYTLNVRVLIIVRQTNHVILMCHVTWRLI